MTFLTGLFSDNKVPVAFLQNLRSFLPWTLIATGGAGRAPSKTFTADIYGQAKNWIEKAQGQRRNICVVMAEMNCVIENTLVVRGHLRGTRYFGVKLTKAKADALDVDNFAPRPFLRLEAGHRVYVVWRLANEVSVEAAMDTAKALATKLDGVSIGHLLPVPGTKHDSFRVQLVYMRKDRENVLTDFHIVPAAAAPETMVLGHFAEDIEPEATEWLWPEVIPVGDLTLLTGQPKVGKTTLATDWAARVSAGLNWPTGEPCAPGQAFIIELEDRRASGIVPRLIAMGADRRRILVRDKELGAIDLSQSVAPLESAIKLLPDLRLLILSPVLSFAGPTTTDDTELRRRLAPLLQWADRYRVAVVGIIHPPKSAGKSLDAQFAGADAWRRVARGAWVAMPDHSDPEPNIKRKRRQMICAGLNGARDDVAFLYRTVAATANGINTSRVEWLEEPGEGANAAATGEAKSAVIVPQPAKARRQGGTRPDAGVWLRTALANGPMDGAKLKREAKAAGIHPPALYRAADLVGVAIEDQPSGFGKSKLWKL